MNVKEAVRVAQEYITDIFAEEDIMNVGLEEVDFDHCADVWKITVGFSRPWDRVGVRNAVVQGLKHPPRSYKVVSIVKEDGHVKSVRDRFMVDSRVS